MMPHQIGLGMMGIDRVGQMSAGAWGQLWLMYRGEPSSHERIEEFQVHLPLCCFSASSSQVSDQSLTESKGHSFTQVQRCVVAWRLYT